MDSHVRDLEESVLPSCLFFPDCGDWQVGDLRTHQAGGPGRNWCCDQAQRQAGVRTPSLSGEISLSLKAFN